MEEIKVADTSRDVSFYAYDSADHISPADGITSFTVYFYLNNGSVTGMAPAIVTEKDSTNMKGWYTLAVDDAPMVSAEGVLSLNIEATGMDPVAIKVKIVGNTTKEVYDVVAHTDYGNAKLVRSTTPANALDVSSTGEAGLDYDNIKDATGAHTLTNITVPTVTNLTNAPTNGDLTATMKTSVNTEADTALTDYDGPTNTEMVTAFTEIKGGTWAAGTDTLEHIRNKQTDIENDTTEIGTAGAGLTDLGGMSTGMKAEIESEANDALVDLKLDHLVAIADSDDPVNDSIISKLAASDGDWSGFDKTTDSQEAIRDRGDTSWVTGAGGSDRLLMVDTTIATLASQISFTLTAGSDDDDAYHNCTIVIEDASTATQKAVGLISAYTGATKTVTLKYDPGIFTISPTDKVYILAENALKATLANRQLNVAADGDVAGNVDGSVASVIGAVGSVSGAVGSISGITFPANFSDLAIVVTSGLVDVTQTAADKAWATATRQLTSTQAFNLTGDITGNLSGSVGSLTGHTVQTGDTFSLANGASGFANIIADTNELQTDWENGGRLDVILDEVKVKTDNLPDGIKKNTAITAFTFLMVQSSDHVTGATGLTIAGSYSGDGGVVTALTNTGAITEISNGLYEIDLTAGELNYENVTLIFTAAGANTRVITIHTST